MILDDRAQVRRRFLEVDAATVADVLDELGILDQGLSPDFRLLSGSKLAGWVYTISGRSQARESDRRSGGDPAKMEACGGIGADEVAVWAGDGRGFAYFGELIATGMIERGCVGALVQGAARDLRWLSEAGFTCFGTFRSAVQSIGRWTVESWQEPVRLPGATSEWVELRPGDFVLGDQDGVVVVPADRVMRVLERVEELTVVENQVREDLSAGSTLSEALERYGHV